MEAFNFSFIAYAAPEPSQRSLDVNGYVFLIRRVRMFHVKHSFAFLCVILLCTILLRTIL